MGATIAFASVVRKPNSSCSPVVVVLLVVAVLAFDLAISKDLKEVVSTNNPPCPQLARRARTRPKKAASMAAKGLALALPAFASSARRIARQRQRRGASR